MKINHIDLAWLIDPISIISNGVNIYLTLPDGIIDRRIIKIQLSLAVSSNFICSTHNGAYVILNTADGNYYIGSTGNLRKRIKTHIGKLRRNESLVHGLQDSYNKTGMATFLISLIESNSRKESIAIEQLLLDTYFEEKGCLNINRKASGQEKHSDIAKHNMSKAHKGIPLTEDNKRNISLALKGRIFSNSHKIKLSEALIGKKKSPEHREKNRLARLGFKHSIESRELMSRKLKERPKKPSSIIKLNHMRKMNDKKKKAIVINNVWYQSATDAAYLIGVNKYRITKRVMNPNILNYRLAREDEKPI